MKSYDEVEQEFQDVRRQQWIANKKAKQEKANVKFRARIEASNVEEKSSRPVKEKTEDVFETFTCQQCFIDFTLSHAEHGDCNFLCIPNVSPVCPICLEENAQEYAKAKKLEAQNGNSATIEIKRN